MQVQDSILREENDSSKTWHIWALFVGLVGFCASFYGIIHYRTVMALGKSDAFCNINSSLNCDAVASSSYSRFLHVPWAVWGTAYFFTVLLLLALSYRRSGNARQEHLFGYGLCVIAGVIVSACLAYISFGVLGVGCLVCIMTYAVSLAQAVLLWIAFQNKYILVREWNVKRLGSGVTTAILGFAAVLISYNIIGEQNPYTPRPVTTSTAPGVQNSESNFGSRVDIPLSLTAYSGLGEDYRKGPDDAKLRLTIFSDFQCPACRGVSELLEEIFQSFPGKILMIYRNYPLDQACNPIMKHPMHQYACELARYARCTGQYGKFWAYHDLAFAKQGELNERSAHQWAKDLGLKDDQIQSCSHDKSIADKLQSDIELGTKLGIDATPTVFVNERRYIGRFQDLKNEIRNLLEH